VIPFFKEATPREIRLMRFFIAANGAMVVFCAVYLVRHSFDAGLRWPWLMLASLAGYFVADFVSGAVHWGMDTWFDESMLGRAVSIAREHHTHPSHVLLYGFLEQSSFGSAPSAMVFGPIALATSLLPVTALTYALMIVWFVVCVCMLFGMHFHNLAHRPARIAILRLAQRLHLLCPPAHHWVHHRQQTIHYCVVNGWANYPCDRLQVWRALERLISALTGAEPRADDLTWQIKFRQTGILIAPRRQASAAGPVADTQPARYAKRLATGDMP
jgi:ubiquitin-conjugating enzyme E2 variant